MSKLGMNKCLILFDGDDQEYAQKIIKHISNFGIVVNTDVSWIGNIRVGENIEDAMSDMVKTCDIIIYLFSANTNISTMIMLAQIKVTYALYVSEVADFVLDYVEKESDIIITPQEAIMQLGWSKGFSIAMQRIFGSRAIKRDKLKAVLFWIPRLH